MEIPDEGCRTARGYLVKVPVRWSDMDVFQHINHARMVTLLEEARIPWLFYDERPTAPLREGCVVVDLNVKYQAQLRHDQGPIEVLMFVEKLRSVDFTVGYEVRPAGAGWRLSGKVTADLVQTCGITLEPLPSQANAEFSVDLVEASEFEPQEDDVEFDVELSDGPDTIEDGGIDLAAYVVEHLALSIDPWPRKPGAVFEAPEGPPEPSPFDVLKDLKPRE